MTSKKKTSTSLPQAHADGRATAKEPRTAEDRLRALFHQCGALLMPNPTADMSASRRRQAYRVLFSCASDEGATEAAALMSAVGFEPGESYRDGLYRVVPIEGGAAVAWFLSPPAGAKPPKSTR